MVTEFPDDDAAAAAVLALASLGNVRTKTMRAFTDGETAAIIPNSAKHHARDEARAAGVPEEYR